MSIKIVSGVLGAGKTYYVVDEILYKYFKFDNRTDEWTPKQEIEIYSNISGLKLPVIDIKMQLQSIDFILAFFNVTKTKESHFWTYRPELKSRVLIIDEAQAIFDKKFSNRNVFEFFQLSRQLGFDIYLITQDATTLSKELQNLSEYDVQAVRRSFHLGPFFRYIKVANSEVIRRLSRPKSQKVFMMYRSMVAKEDSKIQSFPLKMAVYATVLIMITIGAFSWFKSSFHTAFAGTGSQARMESRRTGKPIIVDSVSSGSVVSSPVPIVSSSYPVVSSSVPIVSTSYPVPIASSPVPVFSSPDFNLQKRKQIGYIEYFKGDNDKPDREVLVFETSSISEFKGSINSLSGSVSGIRGQAH